MTSVIARLHDFGQSPWYDNLTRPLVTEGGLRSLIDEDGIRGVTSNPTIFEKAMGAGAAYDDALQACAREGLSIEESYWRLVTEDVGHAADQLDAIYTATGGADGFVSVEVAPDLAHDTKPSIAQAQQLHDRIDRRNVMIKIPATKEGIPAIEANLAAGINTNITLIFSLVRHAEVIEA
jgi:transaldolase